MRGLIFAGVFAASLVFAVGCGGRPAPTSGPSGEPVGGGGPTVPAEATLTDGGIAEIDRAAKDTKNAVVLVEFWTMASEPSPNLALAANSRGGDRQSRGETLGKDKVAWHGVRKAEYLGMRYGDYFLRVIMVNMDGPEKRDEVLDFLKKHDARHVTNIAWKGDPAAAAERYGFTGKAPYQVMFGRKGERVWATGEPLPGALDDLLFQQLDK